MNESKARYNTTLTLNSADKKKQMLLTKKGVSIIETWRTGAEMLIKKEK